MATKKKMLQAAAGQAGGAALDITDVFSTYLFYSSNSVSPVTVTNNIDLAGEGGMVWVKSRTDAGANPTQNNISDTERGTGNKLITNGTYANIVTAYENCSAFNSDGFAYADGFGDGTNKASWTFRKAPKFFDVVTYTGTGSPRTIAHNLGCEVGFMTIKKTSQTGDWISFHRSATGKWLMLNSTDAATTNVAAEIFGNDSSYIAPSSTVFSIGSESGVNANGQTYVAYLFAHNDGDGDFGPDGDQDIIKCGSYSQSSASDVDVDLGFEPQFVIVKRSDDVSQWYVLDEMRGFLAGSNSTSSRTLYANLSNAEADFTIQKTATGFTWPSGQYGSGTQQYIYMAIRRGPLAQPESGTEVFDVQFNGGNDPSKAPVYQSGFVTDMSIVGLRTGGSVNYPYTGNRLMGIQTLETHNTDAEESGGASFQWDFMNGFIDGVPSVITDTQIAWMWKRAPGFCDVVAYSGNSTAGRTVSHNLGVVPEMMWVKKRSGGTARPWYVYHKGNLNQGAGNGAAYGFNLLNTTDAYTDADYAWNETEPSSSSFTLGNIGTNDSGNTYIAYLFASLPNVSKCGSYTGNGSSQTIDCGFTSGARFVLIKKTSNTGHWIVFDTERGIVSGVDPFLKLNNTDAENTGHDAIDPDSSGFIINESGGAFNVNNETYIFYAIA